MIPFLLTTDILPHKEIERLNYLIEAEWRIYLSVV